MARLPSSALLSGRPGGLRTQTSNDCWYCSGALIQTGVEISVPTKDALDSVVGLRNNIAHRGTANVTYQRVAEYYVKVQLVVDRVAAICGA